MRTLAAKGNTLSEYGLCIGLLAFTCVVGLKLMGNSMSNSLTELPKNNGVAQMVHLDFSGKSQPSKAGGSVKLQGGGYYVQTVDPATGNIEFQLTSGGNGSVTNATSLDGSRWNSVGQFQIAETLIKLAEQQTDPNMRAFIMSLAQKSYYMGAAEGEIDAVQQLQQHDPGQPTGDYGKANGLTDIKRLQQDIIGLLNNPPSGMDKDLLTQVNALSLDVYNIGQSYVNTLKGVPDNAQYSFNLSTDTASGVGNGTPGQALTAVNNQVTPCTDYSCGTPQSQGGPRVEDVFTINYLRSVSGQVMQDAGLAPETVVATFTDASTLDSATN